MNASHVETAMPSWRLTAAASNFGFFDAPVHAGGASPDFERLFRGDLLAGTVAGFGSDVGHCLNEMHGCSL
jgi:hypothetical protein